MSKHDTSHPAEPARRADTPAQPDWSRRSAQLLAGVAVIVLIFMGINLGSNDPIAPSPSVTGLPEGETPEPYYYDEATDQHWDPGHNHWHPGPPPPEAQRVASSTTATNSAPAVDATGLPEGETPEPYYYDEANNRYWHEVPGSPGHWHGGPPPPEHQRTSD